MMLLDAVLIDHAGNRLGTLRELFMQVATQEAAQAQLTAQTKLTKLEAEAATNGGVVFNKTHYMSDSSITALVAMGNPSGAGFATFIAPHTLFAHDLEFNPSPR